jgi:hypothetical protein
MPTFEFTSPEGKTYSVNGPDGATPEQAYSILQKHLGGQEKQQAPSMASGIGRAFASGAPMIGGILNKADAATNAALAPVLNPLFPEDKRLKGDFSQRYQQSLREQEGMDKAFSDQHPYVETAANIAGGIAATGLAAGTELGARALGLTAKSLPGMVAKSAASGAAIGGIDSEVRGGDPSEGAIVGGLAGAAGPLVGAGVAKLASPWLRMGRAALSPEIEAADQISGAFEKDAGNGLSRGELVDAQSGRQQPVALMDEGGGRATQRLVRRAANVSPEAQETFDKTIYGRFRSQNVRAADYIKDLTEFGDAHELDKALTESARQVNRPAYEKAYKAGANGIWTDELDQMVQAPVVQDAIRKTMVSAKNEAAKMGFDPPKNPFRFDKDGRLFLAEGADGKTAIPSLQFWDYVKRNLDKGNRDAQDWARLLREHLDGVVPEYGTAREGAKKFFGAKDALQFGRDLVTPGTEAARSDNRVLADALKKLSTTERRLVSDGTLDQFVQNLLGRPDSRDILKSINDSPKARARLALTVGPQKYRQIETYLHVESVMDRFRAALGGNSTTARQLSDMADGSVVPKVRLSIRGAVEDWLHSASSKFGRNIDERVASKIAEMLTSEDGAEYAKALRTIANNKALSRALREPVGPTAPVTMRGGATAADGGSQDARRREDGEASMAR